MKDLLDHQGKLEFQEMKETSDLRAQLVPRVQLELGGFLDLLVHQGQWDLLVPAMRELGNLVLPPAPLGHRGCLACQG